jgi:hypothetical protein
LSDPTGESVTASAERDFLNVLNRLGVLTVTATEDVELRNTAFQFHDYRYNARLQSQPPATLDFLSEYERTLADRIETLASSIRYLLFVQAALTDRTPPTVASTLAALTGSITRIQTWGISLDAQVASLADIHRELTHQRPPRSYSRDTIQDLTEAAEVADQAVREGSLGAIESIIGSELAVESTFLQMDLSLFALRTLEPIREALLDANPIVYYTGDRDKQFIVTDRLTPALVRKRRDRIKSGSRTHRIVVWTQHPEGFTVKPQGLRLLSPALSDDENLQTLRWLRDWLEN